MIKKWSVIGIGSAAGKSTETALTSHFWFGEGIKRMIRKSILHPVQKRILYETPNSSLRHAPF